MGINSIGVGYNLRKKTAQGKKEKRLLKKTVKRLACS